MSRRSDSELKPRNGHTLKVGAAVRISGRPSQKEASLEDQHDNARETITDLYEGSVEFDLIASTRAKGEWLDRPELETIECAYRSRLYDVIVYDDLGRLIRGGEAARLLGIGVDCGTRSICIDDGIDTADETWEEDALNACSENVAYVQRASKRIKQKCMNRFKKHGQVAKRPITGYIIPPDATSYDDWNKDETLTETIQEGARRLRRNLNCSAVASWFNEIKFPLGQFARRKNWDGAKVRAFYSNTLLKGLPQRGKMHSVKHHGSGRRRSMKNPKGPTYYGAPHLAHLTPDEFDDLNAALTEHNAHYRRRKVNGEDLLKGVPRKRTRFPGQHARCWYCGRQYVWGGNGITHNLQCNGAREWKCWNSIGFNGALAAKRLVQMITAELYQLDGFEAQYAEMIQLTASGKDRGLTDRWDALRRNELALQRERDNIAAAIRAAGPHPMLKEQLDGLDARAAELARDRGRLESLGSRTLIIPSSTAELRRTLEAEFEKLATSSPDFGDLMRLLVPEFHVYLVRLCDGGHLLPRARITIDLAGSVADAELVPGLKEKLTRQYTVDLFDPPEREQIRGEAAQLLAEGLMLKQIALRLPGHPTARTVKNALALDHVIRSQDLASPYVTLFEPPEDLPKLRRHKNEKYRFEPLEGYQRPTL